MSWTSVLPNRDRARIYRDAQGWVVSAPWIFTRRQRFATWDEALAYAHSIVRSRRMERPLPQTPLPAPSPWVPTDRLPPWYPRVWCGNVVTTTGNKLTMLERA